MTAQEKDAARALKEGMTEGSSPVRRVTNKPTRSERERDALLEKVRKSINRLQTPPRTALVIFLGTNDEYYEQEGGHNSQEGNGSVNSKPQIY